MKYWRRGRITLTSNNTEAGKESILQASNSSTLARQGTPLMSLKVSRNSKRSSLLDQVVETYCREMSGLTVRAASWNRSLPMYFFSNSPVKWRLTKVVFPVPPSPTRSSEQKGATGVRDQRDQRDQERPNLIRFLMLKSDYRERA